ncbi:hypothetical protein N8468_09235 [Planktomarina temperata]|nr:hypothetical protein [Planktomarina temperata]
MMALLPTLAVADMVGVSVPSAVRETVDVYRAECTNEGGELELDGDEISKLWTDQGEEAYVIHAMFTCGDLGHLWCGAMGCPTQIVLNDVVYETDRILQKPPNRISQKSDGSLTYWMPDGSEFNVQR